MRLVEISIRRLPGITAPFRLQADEIGAHVTLVHGPNAAGKSSLVRALTALLWPELEPSREVDVSARFQAGDRTYAVERHADHVAWRVDGEPSAAPDLPPSHLASCYAITGDELLGGGDAATLASKDGALASEIARQMSGGFDLQRLRDAVEATTRAGQLEAKRLADAKAALGPIERRHRELDAERSELATLREREQRAHLAAQRAAELETALQLDAVRTALQEHAAALQVFPAGMQDLRTDDLDRLRDIDKKLAAERREIEDAHAKSQQCREEIERNALPEEGVTAGALADFRHRLDRISRSETDLGRLEREAAIAVDVRELRRRALHTAATPRVDVEALTRAEDLVRRGESLLVRADVLAREQALIQGEIAVLPGTRAAADARDNSEAARLLTEWLATPEPRPRGSDGDVWSLVAAVIAAAIALGWLVHPAWYALLALPAIALFLRARVHGDGRDRREFEASFARLKSAGPASWTRAAVFARLSELIDERAAIETARDANARVAGLAQRRSQLDEEAAELAVERRRISGEIGLDLTSSDLALTVLARIVLEYLKADVDHAKSRSSATSHRSSYEADIRDLAAQLEGFGLSAGNDAAALSGALTTLAKRAASHSEARASLQNAVVQRERAAQRAAALETERAKLLAATGDERELARRLELLPDWKKALRALEDAERDERALEQRLSGTSQLTGALSRAEIDRELDAARRTAAERDECIRRSADIQARIGEIERNHGLEEALANVQAAKEALNDRRESALDDAATAWLLSSVENAAQQTSQSPVFKRAAASFARFTNHAVELQLSAGRPGQPPAFRAIDTSRGERLALHELSSGTRAQLLLAARVAFVAETERGVTLPLFLDEALANSDPRRFAEIARSLSTLAHDEDRQILYLTSDPLDVQRWREAAPDRALAEVDLARVRSIASATDVLIPLRPAARAIPSPAGMSADQYARALQVPAIDPFASVESWHLHYVLCDELALLHRWLGLRIETVGALRSFTKSSDSRAYASADEVARVEAWTSVYDSILSAWRIGRGRPIGRDVLESAGVSEKFIDDVCAIANEVGGDAKQLVAKLSARDDARLRGWHEKKTASVAEHLAAHGSLDMREPLPERELIARALLAAAPAVTNGLITGEQAVARTTWLLDLLGGRLVPSVEDSADELREARVRV
jgi:ABC-type cobalamin/Fe3+-siderophores transport system ATPase subunit